MSFSKEGISLFIENTGYLEEFAKISWGTVFTILFAIMLIGMLVTLLLGIKMGKRSKEMEYGIEKENPEPKNRKWNFKLED